ncbi:protein of unknown function [Cyanobium sp. NIES-981]|nr:protein of unknown function [Cyanobium sp. NIES-981]
MRSTPWPPRWPWASTRFLPVSLGPSSSTPMARARPPEARFPSIRCCRAQPIRLFPTDLLLIPNHVCYDRPDSRTTQIPLPAGSFRARQAD